MTQTQTTPQNKHPHQMSDAELSKLHTRQLLAMLASSRSQITCGCGSHCEGVISEDETAYNARQDALGDRLKTVLATREHVPTPAEAKADRQARQARPEKKAMRY